MSNRAILYYVIQILIVLAQTSDIPPIMKDIRVTLLSKLAEDIGVQNE